VCEFEVSIIAYSFIFRVLQNIIKKPANSTRRTLYHKQIDVTNCFVRFRNTAYSITQQNT